MVGDFSAVRYVEICAGMHDRHAGCLSLTSQRTAPGVARGPGDSRKIAGVVSGTRLCQTALSACPFKDSYYK